MRYCYNCNKVTIGEPLFCNFCGRSYNTKLCPRMHPNPRNAQACSQCGSRDLSTPQPKVPFWASILLFFLSLLPGFLLALVSITLLFLFLRELFRRPDILITLALLQIILTMLWWGWTQVPLFFRNAVYKMLKRRREGDRRDKR